MTSNLKVDSSLVFDGERAKAPRAESLVHVGAPGTWRIRVSRPHKSVASVWTLPPAVGCVMPGPAVSPPMGEASVRGRVFGDRHGRVRCHPPLSSVCLKGGVLVLSLDADVVGEISTLVYSRVRC